MLQRSNLKKAKQHLLLGSAAENLPAVQKPGEMQAGCLGWEDFPGGGNGHPLQYPCLENSTDRIVGCPQAGGLYSPWGGQESAKTEALST